MSEQSGEARFAGARAAGDRVAFTIATIIFEVRIPWDRIPILLAIAGLATIACSGVGIAIGAFLRDYRAIQPLLLVTFAGTFFASGGFSSIATLPPNVRELNQWWPPAYVLDGMANVALMATPPPVGMLFVGEAIAAVIAIALGAIALRRHI